MATVETRTYAAPGQILAHLEAAHGPLVVFLGPDQYERWGRPSFVIDVAPGAAAGFSLEGGQDVHFTIQTPRRPR